MVYLFHTSTNESNLMRNWPLIWALQIRVEALICLEEIRLFLIISPHLPPTCSGSLYFFYQDTFSSFHEIDR